MEMINTLKFFFISMEPMEALRYVPFLKRGGWVISSSEPLVNIPNYPDIEALSKELKSLPNIKLLDIEAIAAQHQMPKGANMILLGMASHFIEILTPEQLRAAICRIFACKGQKVTDDNCKASDIGLEDARYQ